MLRDHGRYPYLPITRRPDYAFPDGRRLAVYIGYNLEHFAFGEGLGANPFSIIFIPIGRANSHAGRPNRGIVTILLHMVGKGYVGEIGRAHV